MFCWYSRSNYVKTAVVASFCLTFKKTFYSKKKKGFVSELITSIAMVNNYYFLLYYYSSILKTKAGQFLSLKSLLTGSIKALIDMSVIVKLTTSIQTCLRGVQSAAAWYDWQFIINACLHFEGVNICRNVRCFAASFSLVLPVNKRNFAPSL